MAKSQHDLEETYRVIVRGPSELALRIGAETVATFSHAAALVVARKLLAHIGWKSGQEPGLQIGGREPRAIPADQLESTVRQVRQAGMSVVITRQDREAFWGPWQEPAIARDSIGTPRPQRRFVKEAAPPPLASKTARAVDERRVRAAEREAIQAQLDRGMVIMQLFESPLEQLRYEVNHMYLHTVPIPQRQQFPLVQFGFLPSFMADLDAHDGAVSRAQMIAAIVDVVCNRVWETNSRQGRPMRDGGGDDGRPQLFRVADAALAWRANVSSGTPAARRIMWWIRPDGSVELARLATHDDVAMPER